MALTITCLGLPCCFSRISLLQVVSWERPSLSTYPASSPFLTSAFLCLPNSSHRLSGSSVDTFILFPASYLCVAISEYPRHLPKMRTLLFFGTVSTLEPSPPIQALPRQALTLSLVLQKRNLAFQKAR